MADLVLILAFSASVRVTALLEKDASGALVVCRHQPSEWAAGPSKQGGKSVMGSWVVCTRPVPRQETVSPTSQQKGKLSWKEQR